MLSKDFGEYVTIINGDELKKRIFIKLEEYDMEGVFGFVKYEEKYDVKRTEKFLSGSIDRFLYKDKYYEYQKECRLIIDSYVDDDKYFRIGDIRDFDRDGIEYNKFDLLQGITKQQLEYLVSDYHSRDFTNYITSEVNICIDRWY